MNSRLKRRKLRLWAPDYLVNRYMWPNIESSVMRARTECGQQSPVVLDVGCGNQPYRDLFLGCDYFGLNIGTEDAMPSIVGDAMQLPIRTASVDIVLCSQVIEHVAEPRAMIGELCRVLKPGGYLVLTGPFYWPLHEEPHDYYRFTKYGFERLLIDSGFAILEMREDGGDVSQVFLSISLLLRGRILAPLRLVVNMVGEFMNLVAPLKSSPPNYTILAESVQRA